MKNEFEKLAERCEQATGPDRELDKAIARVIGFFDGTRSSYALKLNLIPVFTASIDAATTMVPPGGRWWKAGDGVTGGSRMVVTDTLHDGRWSVFGECPCPETVERNALSLCAAALRAHSYRFGDM